MCWADGHWRTPRTDTGQPTSQDHNMSHVYQLQIIYNFKNNRCLCALNFTSELPEAQRKDPIVYEYSVADWDNIDCGHLLSISEAQLGESVFKSSPGTGFLDWEFLFLQALSLKCQDIDLPLTIRLLAHYSTLHKSKT